MKIYNLAVQVEKMRELQNTYFKYKKKASGTKRPADWEAAAAALIASKTQEEIVDQMVQDIINAGEEQEA